MGFVPTETVTKYQGVQMKSYPILDSLGWILLYFSARVCACNVGESDILGIICGKDSDDQVSKKALKSQITY